MSLCYRHINMMTLCSSTLIATVLSACAEQHAKTPAPQSTATTQEITISQPQKTTDTAPQIKTETTPNAILGHLRLVDNLDRPEDGYCLDILGSGEYVRFDMPMSAHNCKPGLYADEAVVMEQDGRIRFPAYEACATVAGINDTVLAGSAVMPRACGERSAFLESQYLQHFIHRQDGRIELRDSGLCLTVGQQSASTFDASHRWRVLFMQHCEQAPLSHSQWHFVVPKLDKDLYY